MTCWARLAILTVFWQVGGSRETLLTREILAVRPVQNLPMLLLTHLRTIQSKPTPSAPKLLLIILAIPTHVVKHFYKMLRSNWPMK